MTDAIEADRPVGNAPDGARVQFTGAEVTEHLEEKAGRDGRHRGWVDEDTANGTLAGIRERVRRS